MGIEEAEKHRTVGVSLSPDLRRRATARARELGVSFSRYVAQAVEGELRGRVLGGGAGEEEPVGGGGGGAVDVSAAIEEGSDYASRKSQAIGFEDDVEEILRRADLCFTRHAAVAHLRTDFLVQRVEPETDRTLRIAVECAHNVRNRATVTLGQAIIVKSLPNVDGVVLCVPYRRALEAHVLSAFEQHGIAVATPDDLLEQLGRLLRG